MEKRPRAAGSGGKQRGGWAWSERERKAGEREKLGETGVMKRGLDKERKREKWGARPMSDRDEEGETEERRKTDTELRR